MQPHHTPPASFRVCITCQLSLPTSDEYFYHQTTHRLSGECKECAKKRARANNKGRPSGAQRRKARAAMGLPPYPVKERGKRRDSASTKRHHAQWNKQNRISLRALLVEIKAEASCARCGYRDNPLALEFHHTDPATKTREVSQLVGNVGRGRLLEEVAKCEILCANCHTIHHLTA